MLQNRHAFRTSLRHFCAAAQAERKKPTLPHFVITRIKQMQLEIATQFVTDVSPDYMTAASSQSSPSEFSQNLNQMAKYYFQQGGKMFRPTVALLMANACNQSSNNLRLQSEDISHNQYKIAMISEMIHTASLVHDDVIDESDSRRGNASVNAIWGNKMAVLVGDFILARATQILCSIGRPDVISMMASIIEDLVMGEFMQMTARQVTFENRLDEYLKKTYKKTASLFANSCRSVAVLAECDAKAQEYAAAYGNNLGMAFQLVDDLLDFVSSSMVLGKPAASDLKLAPVIFAAQTYPELETLMARKFSNNGDPERARELVLRSDGIERTKELAKKHCLEAAQFAAHFPSGDGTTDVLIDFALSQLDRQA